MKKNSNSVFFPVLINLCKFPCLVVGGGEVANRKVLSLQEFNADITIISPRLCKPLVDLAKANKIKIIRKLYSKKYIKDFKIVFCATNNTKLNKIVHDDCAEQGILINVADAPSLCDFILPANVKRGDLTISISSQGKAPFYAKGIKEKLSQFISPDYAETTELAGDFRKLIMANLKFNSSKIKKEAFDKFLTTDWGKILANEDKNYSREYLFKIMEEIR